MKNDVSRREFITGLCSKDSVKQVLGAWYGFNHEVKKPKVTSCDEAAIMLGKKLNKSTESTKKT